MIQHFRKSFETQEGQSMIIGALMMLLLAFGTLMTLNIGKAVEEKIHAQNVSDSSAYTLAVMEAQAFNMISFNNRVHAAQNNAMMTMQTYTTLLLFVESLLGTIYDFAATIATIFFWVPYLGSFLVGLANLIGGILLGIRILYYGTATGDPKDYGLITLIGHIKKVMWYANYGQYFASLLVGGLIWSHIIDLAVSPHASLWSDNDPSKRYNSGSGWSGTIIQIITAGLNAYEYLKTFDKVAGGIPPIPAEFLDRTNGLRKIPKVSNRANWPTNNWANPYHEKGGKRTVEAKNRQKIMGEISNASRAETFNTKRGFSFDLFIIEIAAKGQTKIISRNGQIDKIGAETNRFKYNVEPTNADGNGTIPDIREKYETHSRYPWGDVMASDQSFQLWVGLKFSIPFLSAVIGDLQIDLVDIGMGVYVLSDAGGGEYWRWKMPRQILGIWGSEKSNLSINPPANGHLRLPIELWVFVPGFIKTAIRECRKGVFTLYWHGCNISGDRTASSCGPNFKEFHSACKNKGSCRRPIKKGCCKGLARTCCTLEANLRRKIANHEAICGDKAKYYYYGIGPYVKFNPIGDRAADFNQPSTWIMLNLPGEKVFQDDSGKSYVWNLNDSNKTSVNLTGSGSKDLRSEPLMKDGKTFSQSMALNIFPAGINVMSRARVYYHRPGNWLEHPNFFNPFWRAQLAPIAQKLTSLLSQNLMVDSEMENQGGLNVGGFLGDLRNIGGGLLNDLVTRVISH